MTEITPTTPGTTSGRKGTPAPADTFETISHVQKRLILTQAGCMTDKQAAQIYYGRAEETLALAAGSFDGKSILYFKSCRGCKFTVNSRALKVFVEDCHSCTFVFAAGVTTGCFEVWNSSDSSFDFAKAAQSIQVDLSNSLRFRFTDRREHFGFLVWAGCEDLSLSLPPPSSASLSSSSSSSALSSLPPIPFSLPIPIPSFSSSATPLSFSSSASPLPPSFLSSSPISIPTTGATTPPTTEENKATKPTTFSMGLDFLPDRSTVDPRTDQFKVTLIEDELVNEPVTRLEGGYPSTQTESSVHQAKKRMRPTPSPSTSPSSSSPSSPSLASSPGLTSPLSLPALSLPSSLLSHLPASFTLPPPPPASPATTSPSTSLSSSPTSSKALPTVAEQENLISLLFAGWG